MAARCVDENNGIREFSDSYGAVVLEREGDSLWVLLILSRQGWSFPKGHAEPGETPREAAEREILEETGVRVRVDTGFAYPVPSAREQDRRTVFFYAGESLEGRKTPEPDEVRGAGWFPVPDARDMVSFPPDLAALEAACRYYLERESAER